MDEIDDTDQRGGVSVEREPVRVALLNDYDIVVAGLSAMLAPFDEVTVVDTKVGDVSIDEPADVALYDTFGRRGIPWSDIAELVEEPLAKHVAIFTFAAAQQVALDALRRGVDGFLWKGLPPSELVSAIVDIAAGERVVRLGVEGGRLRSEGQRWPFDDVGLTARESEVLALLAEGLTNRQIADSLFVGPETVKTHIRHVFRKLGVHTRSEATAVALRDSSFARRARRLSPSDPA